MKSSYNNMFRHRTIMGLVVINMLMLLCIIRVMAICLDTRPTQAKGNSVTVEIGSGRGEIYFCDGKNITSATSQYIAIFLPCEQAMLKYAQLTKGSEKEFGLNRLKNNKPTTLKTKEKIDCVGVYCFEVGDRYGNLTSLEHIVGYTDDTGHGLIGIEKAFDDILYSSDSITASFSIDAKGGYLLGEKPIYNGGDLSGGVHLTIDYNIQKICQQASINLKKGAIVVLESKTGKIKGMVSKPTFDINNLELYVNANEAPLLNRNLCAYSVGSVFKPLIAATLIEENKMDFTYNCKGFCDIGDIRFFCNNRNGHGNMTLETAIEKSCNTYFYNAANKTTVNSLINLATALGFGNSLELAEGIYAQKGNITSKNNLSISAAAVANFAIGQGDIAISPLVISNLYAAIANGGYYRTPTIIEGIKNNGKYKVETLGDINYVFEEKTSNLLKEYLYNVVEKGTGNLAKSTLTTVAGKTATAQTGQFKGDSEILNSWFCGFFPSHNPKYVITVLAEDGLSGGKDCAPIFREIADNISKLGY